MSVDRLLSISQRWFRLLLGLYPPDFRDDMGEALVEAYRDRAREAFARRGIRGLALLWVRALVDALRNGPGERVRPAVAWRRPGNWGRDVELVTRRLVRAPMFALATAGTLTVGLGMVGVAYTAVHKILIEPMPYRDPGDLYFVWRDYGGIVDLKRGALAGSDVAALQQAAGPIEQAAALQPFLGGVFSLREGSDPMEIAVTVSSPNLFELLGVEPAIGRGFAPDEVGPGRPGVIVLSHGLWNRLGADPALVGAAIRLNGRPYTVVGVMPPDFSFVRNDAIGSPQRVDAFTTFEVVLAETNPDQPGYSGLIRVRPGASRQEVEAAVAGVGRSIDAAHFGSRGLTLYPAGLKADVVARVRPALLVLGAAGIVLAIMLLVNLASVLLGRTAQREHELAVSRALGANSGAIARATLLEGTFLGLAGGTLGVILARWGTHALVALAPLDLPRRETIGVDWGIAVTIVALGGALGTLSAALPARWAVRASLARLLASSAVRGGGGHRGLGRSMVVAQVALSVVLLSAAALVLRSFDRLLHVDPGFNADGLLTVRVRTPPEFFPRLADAAAFQDRVQTALAAIPGVVGVGAASSLPLVGPVGQTRVGIPGAPGNTGDAERDRILVDVVAARAGYVEVMGMRVLAGRTFEPTRRAGVPEVMIDSLLARQLFPRGTPLGVELRLGDRPLTIVGVVDHPRLHDLHRNGRPLIFARAEDFGVRPLFFAMRTIREPRAILPDVRSAVRRLDPRVAVGDERTMEEIVGNAVRHHRTSAVLIAAFAAGALLLAGMGLFSVVAGSVTRRRHELAVRLALGADARRVLRLVVGEGAVLVGLGVLLAVPGVYAGSGVIRGVLVGVTPTDPVTLAVTATSLALVAMTACYVPARRALAIDPAQLLRQE
ncbi:MAG TPA: ABC transporter permease [Vicinamibacterales bacterium]|nr:ABC transporter permease [Vicinamibacterales bacterium]